MLQLEEFIAITEVNQINQGSDREGSRGPGPPQILNATKTSVQNQGLRQFLLAVSRYIRPYHSTADGIHVFSVLEETTLNARLRALEGHHVSSQGP